MYFKVPDPPMTLSNEEQSRLLEVVARQGNRRDLALLTVALGTPDAFASYTEYSRRPPN